jgi:hypothetical protein
MLTPEHLLRLARIYGDASDLALSGVGLKACGNNRTLGRLAAGGGANVRTLERIEDFFLNYWPPDLAWPADIPRARRSWNDPSPHRTDDFSALIGEDAE